MISALIKPTAILFENRFQRRRQARMNLPDQDLGRRGGAGHSLAARIAGQPYGVALVERAGSSSVTSLAGDEQVQIWACGIPRFGLPEASAPRRAA